MIAGTWRQQRYGNVRWRPALIIGLAAIGGVEAGVALAEELPEHILRKLFGVLMHRGRRADRVAGQAALAFR